MVTLKNILVATDFSEPSTVALNYGRDLARSYNARLHVLHVVEDVMMRYSSEIGFALPQVQQDLEAAATRELNGLITEDDRKTLSVVTAVETGVNISEVIVKYAKEHAIESISESVNEISYRARVAGHGVQDFVATHAIPLTLAGVGLGWLMVSLSHQRRLRVDSYYPERGYGDEEYLGRDYRDARYGRPRGYLENARERRQGLRDPAPRPGAARVDDAAPRMATLQ